MPIMVGGLAVDKGGVKASSAARACAALIASGEQSAPVIVQNITLWTFLLISLATSITYELAGGGVVRHKADTVWRFPAMIACRSFCRVIDSQVPKGRRGVFMRFATPTPASAGEIVTVHIADLLCIYGGAAGVLVMGPPCQAQHVPLKVSQDK
jgi:hypothetical protein